MTIESDLRARSPWASLSNVESVRISPAKKTINTKLSLPGSKSFSNRALILAAFAKGESKITGLLKSDDTYWCLQTLQEIGATVRVADDLVCVIGIDRKQKVQKELYIGAAGTTARFLPGLLAGLTNDSVWRMTASKRMSERPIEPLVTALRSLGADVVYQSNPRHFPIKIGSKGFVGGQTMISGSMSSQFISGLLMASPMAARSVTIQVVDGIVQQSYVQITIDMMKQFGVDVDYTPDYSELRIQSQDYQATDLQLESDASTACYFFALAAVTGGTVTIDRLSYFSLQPDVKFVDILETMGCTVERSSDAITVQGPQALKGNLVFDMKACSDQALTLAAIAPFADGPIEITNVAHIRHHESDRIHVAYELLTQMGIEACEHLDGLKIHPGLPRSIKLATYDDHRVAMAFSLVGAVVEGVKILDPGCVSKTCPPFFTFLEQVGLGITFSERYES